MRTRILSQCFVRHGEAFTEVTSEMHLSGSGALVA